MGRRPKSLGKVQCDILTGDINIEPLEFYYVDMGIVVTVVVLHCRNYNSGLAGVRVTSGHWPWRWSVVIAPIAYCHFVNVCS